MFIYCGFIIKQMKKTIVHSVLNVIMVTRHIFSSKFLVVAPRRLFAGKYEKIWVTFTDNEANEKSSLTINLLHPEDSSIVLSTVNLKQSGNFIVLLCIIQL